MKKESPRPLTRLESSRLVSDLTKLKEEGVNTIRPTVRSDCPKERPCAFVSCVYNTFLDVDDSGRILYNQGNKSPWEVNPETSCTLDIAERISQDIISNKRNKGFPNKAIGEILGGVSRETIRLMSITAQSKIKFLYELNEETMSMVADDSLPAEDYDMYKFTFEEVIFDFGLKTKVLFKWVKNGLAFYIEDGKHMVTLMAIHDYFSCNYKEFYCLPELDNLIKIKYKLYELGERFNA